MKVKVHEVAKSLNLKSTEIINILKGFGGRSRTYNSSLVENELDIVFDYLTQKHQVEEFDFIMEKLKKDATESEADVQEVIEDINIEELNTPIVKKAIYVDTRMSSVDLEKYDTEKLEELVPDNIDDIKAGKQKIKKATAKVKRESSSEQDKKPRKKKQVSTTIQIPDEISVGEFAEKLEQPAAEVVKRLMMLGVMASVSQTIDFDTAAVVAQDFNINIEKEVIITEEELIFNDVEDLPEQLEPRSPVVVVMGHVDHGKTKLIDSIRKTNVIDTEAGGITQHIGAYMVKVNNRDITFLDTPGHEAFTAMRSRGAQVTDIAILVVAADDGVKQQTIEAINHAKAAGLNIIVAINKIDKETANPEIVKQQLTEHSLIPEEWGGDTICVPISALKGENIDTLLEMVLLVADMKELKANPNRAAKGAVISP
jgi:translation initiation factor IF-2